MTKLDGKLSSFVKILMGLCDSSPMWFASYCIGRGLYPVHTQRVAAAGFPGHQKKKRGSCGRKVEMERNTKYFVCGGAFQLNVSHIHVVFVLPIL